MACNFYFTSSFFSLSLTHTHISIYPDSHPTPYSPKSPFDYELLVLSHQNSWVSFINSGSLCWVCSSKTYSSGELEVRELIPNRISVLIKIKLNIRQNVVTKSRQMVFLKNWYTNQVFLSLLISFVVEW